MFDTEISHKLYLQWNKVVVFFSLERVNFPPEAQTDFEKESAFWSCTDSDQRYCTFGNENYILEIVC